MITAEELRNYIERLDNTENIDYFTDLFNSNILDESRFGVRQLEWAIDEEDIEDLESAKDDIIKYYSDLGYNIFIRDDFKYVIISW